jgi:CheY-like chemotaxis protein
MRDKINCLMVIDDDEPTNFINEMIIEEADCTNHVEILDSGLKALSYLKKSVNGELQQPPVILPDLIFLDINMPRMNGWEFLDQYKKMEFNANNKPVIIMLTTSINPDDKKRAENIPEVAGFENKPLTIEMIDRVIKTHLNAS